MILTESGSWMEVLFSIVSFYSLVPSRKWVLIDEIVENGLLFQLQSVEFHLSWSVRSILPIEFYCSTSVTNFLFFLLNNHWLSVKFSLQWKSNLFPTDSKSWFKLNLPNCVRNHFLFAWKKSSRICVFSQNYM